MKSHLSPADLRALIEAARGLGKCDVVVRGAFVLNVYTGETTRADVGIAGRHIALVSPPNTQIEADRVIDADRLFLLPGFIDSHVHLESSLLTPAEFVRAVLPTGTTAVVIDPHEIAGVAGADGIRELIAAAADLPVTFYVTIPSCVPALDLDAAGVRLDAADMADLAALPNVVGVAEMMNYRGVLEARDDVLEKLTCLPHCVIDGHAPGLSGRDLQAYIAAGISSDHETTDCWEGLEKLRAGMYLMIREGSVARNLDDLARLVNNNTFDRCLLVTDDLLPTDIIDRGHINHLLRRMVHHGVTPARAVRMATLNAAQRFGIERVGAVAAGCVADIVAVEDLADFDAAFVIAKGQLAAVEGGLVEPVRAHGFSPGITHTVHLPELCREDFIIAAGEGDARVMEAIENQIVTRRLFARPATLGGRVVSDTENDILKIVVVERHGRSGSIGRGLVKGFHLKSGAIAGSVAHDSHNVVAVGANDQDILVAVQRVGEIDGGLVVAAGGNVIEELPLPIGGLMSLESGPVVAARLRRLEHVARELGCPMSHPFMTLSFMCLPVVPELKLTAEGLFDVDQARIVPLFAEEPGETEIAAAG